MTMYNIDGTVASKEDQEYYKERALELCDEYHSYDCFVIMPDNGDGYLEPFETITDMRTWLNQN